MTAHAPPPRALTITLALALAACSSSREAPADARAEATTAPTSTASANAAAPKPLEIREGDFEGALAEARRENKLLFVDGWAPWCHTCLSMRETVFPDASLRRFAESYVFVEIDTDQPASTAFVQKHPMRAWPTFFVIDPRTREVVASYGGSMSLAELTSFLDRGIAASKDPGPGYAELAEGHRAILAGDAALAAVKYEAALRVLEPAHRREAVSGLLRALATQKDDAKCTEAGLAHADGVVGSSAKVDVLLQLGRCAAKAPAALREKADAFVLERLPKLVETPPEGASVDDRSDAMGAWASLLDKQGKKEEALAVQARRIAMLEAAAANADTPEQQQVYDYERMLAYLAAGRGADAVAMFEKRTKELPTSYEAFARHAYTLVELGRAADALAPADKAIELAYGPRKLRYMALKAKALVALGKTAEARAVLEAELAGWKALPPGHFDQAKVEDAEKRLAAVK